MGRRLRRLGRTGVARAGPVRLGRLRATLGHAQLLAAWAVRARVGWLLARPGRPRRAGLLGRAPRPRLSRAWACWPRNHLVRVHGFMSQAE